MPNIVNRFVEFLKKNNLRIDRNIITYLICVVIATILWFLNALNKDYTAVISYPVKYVNLPQGKHLVTDLPSTLSLEVRAKGFALLGHRISTSFLPITFNVNTYSNHLLEKDEVFEYTLNTNEIKDKISNQLNTEIKLLDITPATIEFKFAQSVEKMIAVRPVVNYTLKRQYILNQITATPDSILVSGPATIIDTLQYVSTKSIRLKDLGKSVSKEVELTPLRGCTVDDVTIKLDLQVEQFTETKKTVKLRARNVPESLYLRLFPDNINITYDVGLSNYEKISNQDFEFYVDYNQTTSSSFLDVKVGKTPAYIKNLVHSPQKVEYIIERK